MEKGKLILGWKNHEKGTLVVAEAFEIIDDFGHKIKELGKIEEEEVVRTLVYYMNNYKINKLECDGMTLTLERNKGE